MLRAVADTHAFIWYLYGDSRLSSNARAVIDEALACGDQIGFSTITLVEAVYLMEKRRIPPATFRELITAGGQLSPMLLELPLTRPIAATMPEIRRSQVPDMPDRIIAATAQYYGVPLISRDRKITASGLSTIWEREHAIWTVSPPRCRCLS